MPIRSAPPGVLTERPQRRARARSRRRPRPPARQRRGVDAAARRQCGQLEGALASPFGLAALPCLPFFESWLIFPVAGRALELPMADDALGAPVAPVAPVDDDPADVPVPAPDPPVPEVPPPELVPPAPDPPEKQTTPPSDLNFAVAH